MAMRIVWGVTGAGDLLPQCIEQIQQARQQLGAEVHAIVSSAAVKVLGIYKLEQTLEQAADKVQRERDANTPFIVGPLQVGKYGAMVVAPLTSNSAAKIALGISDTLITNAVAQANKAMTPVLLLPVDQKPGEVTTIMPGGKPLRLRMRPVDLEHVERLRQMEGIDIIENPQGIIPALRDLG